MFVQIKFVNSELHSHSPISKLQENWMSSKLGGEDQMHLIYGMDSNANALSYLYLVTTCMHYSVPISLIRDSPSPFLILYKEISQMRFPLTRFPNVLKHGMLI